MYKIYANNICIHNGLSQDPTIKAAEATLTEEDNRSGSLEFKIAPSNIGYKSITPMATTIVINKVDSDTLEETSIWVGRVTQKNIDFYNCESCYCEGALSFLVDTFQEKETFEGTVAEYFEKLLSTHNKKVSQNRRIKLGTIQADSNLAIKVDLDYANTLECINTGVIEPLKGHIEIEIPTNYTSSTFESSPTLNYYKDWKPGTSQSIDFGKNLLDMTRNFDVTDLVTAIYPRGASITNENGVETVVDISSVNDGSKILINEELRSKYGYIEKVVDFSDIEDPQKLLEAARTYFTDSQFDDMSIEVSAFDMSYLRFGQQTEEVYSPFRLLEKVHCISTPHGLDREFPITKIVTDLLDPVRSVITLNSSKGNDLSAMGGGSITVNQIYNTEGHEQIDSDMYAVWEPAISDLNYYEGSLYDNSTPNGPIPYGIYYPIDQNSSNRSPFKYFCSGQMIPLRTKTAISDVPFNYNVVIAWGYISLEPISLAGLYPIYDMALQTTNDGTAITLISSFTNVPAINIVTKERRHYYGYTDKFAALIGPDNLFKTKLILSFSLESDAKKYIEHVLSSDWKGVRQYTYISRTKETSRTLNTNINFGAPDDAFPLMASRLLTIGDIKDGRLCPGWKDKISLYTYNPLFSTSEGTKDLYVKGMLDGDYTNGVISIRGHQIHSNVDLNISAAAGITINGDSIDFSATKIFF